MRLVEEGEALAGLWRNRQAVIADNVTCEATGPAEADCGAVAPFTQHGGAVGGLDHVGHVAGGADIGDADGHAIVKDIKQFADQYACVEGNCLAGFQIDVAAGFGTHRLDEFDQIVALVIGAGDMVATAEIEPFQLAEIGCNLGLQAFPCAFKRFEVLLAQCMEMQARYAFKMLWP